MNCHHSRAIFRSYLWRLVAFGDSFRPMIIPRQHNRSAPLLIPRGAVVRAGVVSRTSSTYWVPSTSQSSLLVHSSPFNPCSSVCFLIGIASVLLDCVIKRFCNRDAGIINSMTVQPVVGAERPVYFRERAAGMYSVLPFSLAQIAVEIPYNFVQVSV